MAHRPLHLAVVGATDLVGRAILEVLEDRNVALASLRLFTTDDTAAPTVEFRGDELPVAAPSDGAFRGCDVALLAVGPEAARALAPRIRADGVLVVDGSDAFRADPDVPLVVPDVNPEAVIQAKGRGIVASPGPIAAAVSTVLAPLAREAGLERASIVALQSASIAGQPGLDQLEREARDLLSFREPEAGKAFAARLAFNLVPLAGAVGADGSTAAERELATEPRKVLGLPDLRLSATCVRVPVFYGHAAAVTLATVRPLPAAVARELLREAPGVKVLDAPAEGVVPMPMLAVVDDGVEVGRIRDDATQPNGLTLFVAVDDVKTAAAGGLVRIAGLLAEQVL
jgi:aspartate-semialdehyde dehydrogenase